MIRKPLHLVRLRTALLLSLQNIVTRNCGVKLKASNWKILTEDRVQPYLQGNEDLMLAGSASKVCINDHTEQIQRIEAAVERKLRLHKPYTRLLDLPEVERILASTIQLETGPISRFAQVGNDISYCRKVSSQGIRNEKAQGKGNQKNGNKGLAWAFSEAAEFARRYHAGVRAYYQRKMPKPNFMVAHGALAPKLARPAHYIMKDQVPFRPEKLFAG